MRIEPQHGQDIPVECSEAVLQIGNKLIRLLDRGDHLQIDPLSKGLTAYGGEGTPLRIG